ncbi:MAG: hypothetical protein COB83_09735 [Gammaproteobacteria bacterium]|nr:MAG: hypothetical protein COB83_09735 [Gammaproteobacteria bacterium]
MSKFTEKLMKIFSVSTFFLIVGFTYLWLYGVGRYYENTIVMLGAGSTSITAFIFYFVFKRINKIARNKDK